MNHKSIPNLEHSPFPGYTCSRKFQIHLSLEVSPMRHLHIGTKKHNYTHPHKPRYASPNAIIQRHQFNGIIKTITYNIRLSKKTDKALQLISEHDELNNADIVCLQEMDPAGVKLIADTLQYNYVYYPAILHPRSNKDFGNAILAKWPIIADQKIILSKTGSGKLQRIAVSATIRINHANITVICVHMKMFSHQNHRRIPIDQIISSIDPSSKHCIIAGDFNTFSKSNCKAIWEPFNEANFLHVTGKIGSTYKYWYLLNRKASLDHIFIRGMSIVRAGKVANRKASDHIPIWGEMKLVN